MIKLELTYKTSIGQNKYLTTTTTATATTTDWMLKLVLAQNKTKKAHSIRKQSYKFKQELNICQNEENDTSTSTKQATDINETSKI